MPASFGQKMLIMAIVNIYLHLHFKAYSRFPCLFCIILHIKACFFLGDVVSLDTKYALPYVQTGNMQLMSHPPQSLCTTPRATRKDAVFYVRQ